MAFWKKNKVVPVDNKSEKKTLPRVERNYDLASTDLLAQEIANRAADQATTSSIELRCECIPKCDCVIL